jgi:hypothetical protein
MTTASYPTKDEFRKLVERGYPGKLGEVVRQYLFTGLPYAFKSEPETCVALADHIHRELKVPAENVFVVGSSKTGFSLNPDHFGAPFGENSDIDVAVVGQELFDSAWRILRAWHYPYRIGRFPSKRATGWASERRRSVFFGLLEPGAISYEGLSFPDALRPLQELTVKWFNAFHSLSLTADLARYKVEGILFRTLEHAVDYYADGLRLILTRPVEAAQGE